MARSEMYRWRRLSAQQRADLLAYRRQHHLPWHSPPHYCSETGVYLVTAACYEHRHIIGHSLSRMAAFEMALLETCRTYCSHVHAWTLLPNHYHALVRTADLKVLTKGLGCLHGATSFQWNAQEDRRGRKVWFGAAETGIKSERHFWASFVYVLHNAVKHGYVRRWQDWTFCNARQFLDQAGRQEARRLWLEFPIDEYGATWDPPEL